MPRARYDVCAAVVSDLRFDARVWKEARSLADAGYRVRVVGCHYDGRSAAEHRDGMVDVLTVSLGSRDGRVSRSQRGRTLLRLWREIVATPAEVYHAHNIHVGPAAWLACRLRRAALVYDAHELYGEAVNKSTAGRIGAFLERRLERFLVSRSDYVITTNTFRAEKLRERHGPLQIEVLANVPATVRRVEPLDPGYPPGAKVLLYQGGIYAKHRAFRQTIEALPLLDGVHLVILGFGREQELERIAKWAQQYGVSQRVHLLPPRPFEELVHTAAAASVGLVPIVPRRENDVLADTNKLFEYLMAGLPVVASDLPEMRRVLLSGEFPVGELFDPMSPESIARAVRSVLSDGKLYEQRRKEARRLALTHYNWNVEEGRLLALYRDLLSHAEAGRLPDEAVQ
jgi:glycosyltransferase involved in cell wall biosynthesis